jgi:Mn-dependent DtxR family transcriptional regulator
MPLIRATLRQQALLTFIAEHRRETGEWPSIVEIAQSFRSHRESMRSSLMRMRMNGHKIPNQCFKTPPEPRKFTKEQTHVLRYMYEFLAKHRRYPNRNEIAQAFKQSLPVMNRTLRRLEARGAHVPKECYVRGPSQNERRRQNSKQMMDKILDLLREDQHLTCRRIARHLGVSHTTAATRLNELLRKGLVRHGDKPGFYHACTGGRR